MNSADLILFFIQISVMLGFALVFGQIMRKFNQPAVLGEFIGGIILGPTIFGLIAPKLYIALFPINTAISQGRDILLTVGMLFFLFSAGMEINLTRVRERKSQVLFTAILGCLIPFSLGFGSVFLFPDSWNWPASVNILVFALFIGMALCISALPVISRILMDLRLLEHEVGIVILSAATIDDLIGWSLFAVLLSRLGISDPGRNLAAMIFTVVWFSVLIIGIGRLLGRFLFGRAQSSTAWPGFLISAVAVFILAAAAVAEYLGLHAIFGAFLVGVSLHSAFRANEETHAREIIYQFAISFFAPLYFVSIGLRANFLANFDLYLVLLVIAIATIGKVGGACLGALLGGISLRNALAIGFGMNARGAIEMILATVALEHGLIDQRIYVALVTMALVTSMASGPLIQRFLRKPEPIMA